MSNIVEYMYSKEKGVDGMKDVVLDEVMKELSKKEMERIFKRICIYFNKDKSLIEKFKQNKNIDF